MCVCVCDVRSAHPPARSRSSQLVKDAKRQQNVGLGLGKLRKAPEQIVSLAAELDEVGQNVMMLSHIPESEHKIYDRFTTLASESDLHPEERNRLAAITSTGLQHLELARRVRNASLSATH